MAKARGRRKPISSWAMICTKGPTQGRVCYFARSYDAMMRQLDWTENHHRAPCGPHEIIELKEVRRVKAKKKDQD